VDAIKNVKSLCLARNAMGTRFEFLLHGNNATALRTSGEEALDEIERLDAQLNLYNPASELSHLNLTAAQRPVRVEPGLFRLLNLAKSIAEETEGAFDVSIAPLMRCWGFMGDTGRMPSGEQIREARERTGMRHVVFDEENWSVHFEKSGMMLDLGAIGKGYALERAVGLLRESGIESALLHGGTSTVYALGTPPGEEAWQVAIEKPDASRNHKHATGLLNSKAEFPTADLLTILRLKDESLSVSAVWGKSFEANGRLLGHVIDPRSGYPTSNALLAAVALPSCTESDALSTALLVLGKSGKSVIPRLRPGMRWLIAGGGGTNAWMEGNVFGSNSIA
jgi:thiamine biosynthesis lipoprotein